MRIIDEKEVEQQCDDFWKDFEEGFLNFDPFLSKIVLRDSESFSVLMVKEIIRRVREDLGSKVTLLFFSQPTMFTEKFISSLTRHSENVKREAFAGSLVVKGIPVKIPDSESYDLEDDIKESKEGAKRTMEALSHEIAFQKALEDGNFDDAETILEGMELVKKDGNVLDRVGIRNWKMRLAVAKGDLEVFLDVLHEALFDTDERVVVFLPYLRISLKEIIVESLISGIMVSTTSILSEKEREDINDIFWSSLVRYIIEFLKDAGKARMSAEDFKALVKMFSEDAISSVKFFPRPLEVVAVWL